MWEVTGKAPNGTAAKFYILAVTHNGLNVEYDAYFHNKVIPAFVQSTVFSFEGASLVASQVPECPKRLDQTKENIEILRAGRERVQAAYFQRLNSGEKPTDLSETLQEAALESKKIFAKSITDKLSEYGLILAMKEHFQAIKQGKKLTNKIAIVTYLALRGKDKKFESIDSASDMIEAYCDIGASRAQEFKRQIFEWDPSTGLEMTSQLERKGNNDFVKSLQENKISVSLMEEESVESWKSYVCDRNNKWSKRIVRELSDEKRFYAFGIAHLLPQEEGPFQCDDLLTLLQKAGMRVALVK